MLNEQLKRRNNTYEEDFGDFGPLEVAENFIVKSGGFDPNPTTTLIHFGDFLVIYVYNPTASIFLEDAEGQVRVRVSNK